jgi:hypothetical protein
MIRHQYLFKKTGGGKEKCSLSSVDWIMMYRLMKAILNTRFRVLRSVNINPLKPNTLTFYILPTHTYSTSVFRMVLTINSNCFPKQHEPFGLCSGDNVSCEVRTELYCVEEAEEFISVLEREAALLRWYG